MSNPLVSIRVLAYNHEKTIAMTLDKLLEQKCDFNFQIIIGDDCSTDGTRAILMKYQKKYPDTIKLILNEQNLGLLKNFKNVTELCIQNSKYIAGCAGDDYWTDPLKLQKQVDFLEANPDYGLCYTDFAIEDNRTGKLIESKYSKYDRLITLENQYDSMLIDNYISGLTVCIRSSLIAKYFDFIGEDYFKFLMEDKPLWLFSAHYSKFYFLNEITATYRKAYNSISHPTNFISAIKFWSSFYEISDYFINSFGSKPETLRLVNQKRYRTLFNLSWNLYNSKSCKESYKYLKNNGYITVLDRIKYLIANNYLLFTIFKRIIAIRRYINT